MGGRQVLGLGRYCHRHPGRVVPRQICRGSGAAAEIAAERKSAKYTAILPAYCFAPLSFETLGPINHEGMAFFNNLGHRLAQITGDSRETTFLYQRLSVAIQHFNALAFHGTFGTDIIED